VSLIGIWPNMPPPPSSSTNQSWKKFKNVWTQTFFRCKMSSKLHWGNSSKSAIISFLTSFSSLNQAFVPHFYPQTMILNLIPKYLTQNKSKSPHKYAIATYVYDFCTKLSSILKPRVQLFPALSTPLEGF
jgi:hypothetical protein